jgi:hypothetical protein
MIRVSSVESRAMSVTLDTDMERARNLGVEDA